jgi:hypothetical protein
LTFPPLIDKIAVWEKLIFLYVIQENPMTHKKYLLLLFLLFAKACMMPEIITTYQAKNDLVMKDTWKNFLSENPAPKVVLRVPAEPREITQSEMMYYNSLYNYIERRLLETDFIVRDRSLLKEVLNRAGGELNYADIGKKIDTDIIIEIVNVKFGTWMRGIVSSSTQGESDLEASVWQAGRTTSGTRPGASRADVFGAVLEGRIIMVSTGNVVGMFTLKELHPRPEEWEWIDDKGNTVRISSDDLSDSDSEYLRNAITRKLTDYLKGLDVSNSIVSSESDSAVSSSGTKIGRWGRKGSAGIKK